MLILVGAAVPGTSMLVFYLHVRPIWVKSIKSLILDVSSLKRLTFFLKNWYLGILIEPQCLSLPNAGSVETTLAVSLIKGGLFKRRIIKSWD